MRLRYLTLFVLSAALCGPVLAHADSGEHAVSYVWSGDLKFVQRYRDKVARVLGPRVAKDLKVVRDRDKYGLIYDRRGEGIGADKVARIHTRLLESRGLGDATPLGSRRWTMLDGGRFPTPAVSRGWIISTANAALSTTADMPLPPAATDRQRRAPELELAVDRYIKELRRNGELSPDERTAWSVLDFTTGEKLVSINEDVQMQAASLVKPFFALAFFHKVKEGRLIYGPKSRRHMERMIQRSHNRSSNWVIRHAGGPAAVQKILNRHYPEIFQDTRIVEYIPANGRTYRNKASVSDYNRFLSALWNDELPGAHEIKRLMTLPGPDRLFTGAQALPDGTTVYNKTGSTSRLCGDMGILVVEGEDGRNYPYTLIGVIEKKQSARNYTTWIRSRADVIRNVSDIVYRGISQHHNLHSSL